MAGHAGDRHAATRTTRLRRRSVERQPPISAAPARRLRRNDDDDATIPTGHDAPMLPTGRRLQRPSGLERRTSCRSTAGSRGRSRWTHRSPSARLRRAPPKTHSLPSHGSDGAGAPPPAAAAVPAPPLSAARPPPPRPNGSRRRTGPARLRHSSAAAAADDCRGGERATPSAKTRRRCRGGRSEKRAPSRTRRSTARWW